MAINLTEKFSDKVAERFTCQSLTDAYAGHDYDFSGVKSIKIYSVDSAPVGDYTRSGTARFGDLVELGDTVQEMVMTQDKGFTFSVDAGNNAEQLNIKQVTRRLKRNWDERATPLIDMYRFKKWMEGAALVKTEGSALTGTGTYTDSGISAKGETGPQGPAGNGWSPNLLDNWYFPAAINQQGAESYEKGLTVDRWRILGAKPGFKADVSVPGVLKLVGGTADVLKFFQNVDPNRLLAGETYTYSLLYDDGNGGKLLTCTGDPGGDEGLSAAEEGVVTISCGVGNRAYINVAAGATVFPIAAKLERGASQTLARQLEDGTWGLTDPPPDVAAEMLKCQRYYRKSWVGRPLGEMSPSIVHPLVRLAGNTDVLSSVEFPAPMARVPTVKVYSYDGKEGYINHINDDGEIDGEIQGCGPYQESETGFFVMSLGGQLTPGEPYSFFYTAMAGG